MMLARWVQLHCGKHADIRYVFANTGEEHPRTLDFVNECDRAWGLGVVWVEAVVNPGRKGCTHKIVTYETASRNGEPFEAVIAKYGISNKSYPHCTRELKLNPMRSYIRSIGWSHEKVAVGMRADEPKRISKSAEVNRIVYPFAHWWPQDKQDVISWWEDQPFRLGLAAREGNCKWCWKKSLSKHAANIASEPQWYNFPRRMEALHGFTNRQNNQVFFRGALSTDELFKAVSDVQIRHIDSCEETGGCSESCEAFGCEV